MNRVGARPIGCRPLILRYPPVSEPTLSAFVLRCQKAMAEYQRLRFLGISHEIAAQRSGFMSAVKGEPVDPVESMRDVRKAIAGDVE